MRIAGLQKLTLLDFPGKVACTVFTAGCNFRCPFCQNSSLVLPERFGQPIAEEELLRRYRVQLLLYREALNRRFPDTPVKEVLIYSLYLGRAITVE